MSISTITTEQRRKLDGVIKSGVACLDRIKMERDGMNEDIKAIAEELGCKPKHVRRIISIAHKSSYTEFNEDNDIVETLLESTGRTA